MISRRLVPVSCAASFAALAIVLTSCSSTTDGSPARAGSTPPATASSSTPSTGTPSTDAPSTGSGDSSASVDAPTQADLQSVVVQQGDLPTGWTGKPPTPEDASDKVFDAQLYACVGVSDSGEESKVASVSSDDFQLGNATISSDVTSYSSPDAVQKQIDVLSNPKTNGCLNEAFNRVLRGALPAGTSVSRASVKLDLGSGGGPSNVVGTGSGSATVQASGQTVVVYFSLAFITGRQLTGNVSFTSVGQPLSSSLESSLIGAVAQRAADA